MILNPKILASINVVLQIILMSTVLVAAYQSRIKKQFIKHCRIVKWAIIGQVLSLLFVMLPAIAVYLKTQSAGLRVEVIVHASLGVVTLFLWVLISLAVARKIRLPGKRSWYMRVTLVVWAIAFMLGLYIYLRLYWLG